MLVVEGFTESSHDTKDLKYMMFIVHQITIILFKSMFFKYSLKRFQS